MDWLCGRFQDELPDPTAESANDNILSNATSLDETLMEDRYKQNLRRLEIVPSTICAEMITEMRGADLIVFELI